MELDDLSKSGIRRIADYSPYLDQLAGLAQQMGLRQRSNLMHVETALRSHWSLGQNSILSWVPLDQSILILVVPHYAIAEYTSSRDDDMPPRVSPRFITELISGDRQLTITQMQKVARLLDIEPSRSCRKGKAGWMPCTCATQHAGKSAAAAENLTLSNSPTRLNSRISRQQTVQ